MHSAILAALLACLLAGPAAACSDEYIGEVQTQWLDDGRTMRLLSPFAYCEPDGDIWEAPAGSVVDGASIPQIAWTVIGGPFEGLYRNASVIHDVACDQKSRSWQSVHEAFYFAMIKSGVSSVKSKVMYAAVYLFGPRWDEVVIVRSLGPGDVGSAIAQAQSRLAGGGALVVDGMSIRFEGTTLVSEFIVRQKSPPPLPPTQFDAIRNAIEEREAAAPGSVSLEEIRSFATTR